MIYKDEEFAEDDNRQQTNNNTEPNAYRTDDGAGLDEKDLEKTYLFGKGDFEPHPTEGQGTGGEKFGQENLTPAGNDKNNPSQLAGSTNAYFDRKEPSEEHPEDSNFTVKNQDGAPNYSKAEFNKTMENTDPKPEEVKRGDGENDRPHPQQPYTEGTDDNDGTDGDEIEKEERETNIPGPNELPAQLKVGE
ncbi:hypothetical protein [Mucilaginibacter sp.]